MSGLMSGVKTSVHHFSFKKSYTGSPTQDISVSAGHMLVVAGYSLLCPTFDNHGPGDTDSNVTARWWVAGQNSVSSAYDSEFTHLLQKNHVADQVLQYYLSFPFLPGTCSACCTGSEIQG